jgi:hypothetical protein
MGSRGYTDMMSSKLTHHKSFVSLLHIDDSQVGPTHRDTITPFYKNGQLRIAKIPWLNSVLFHSKSFDDLLLVTDVDEVMVSMAPTTTSIVDVLLREPLNSTCSFKVKANIVEDKVWTRKENRTLAEQMPYRCNAGLGGSGAYEKSVAVVANSDLVGLHEHAGCRLGTKRRALDPTTTTLLHYTGLRQKRWSTKNCNATLSELTLFERSGVQFRMSRLDASTSPSQNHGGTTTVYVTPSDLYQEDSTPTPKPWQIPNRARTNLQ